MSIYDLQMSKDIDNEFQDIQSKSWEIAGKLNPMSHRYGFNINSTYQSEIYPEFDDSPQEEWYSADLTWTNFVSLFPEYIEFCNKYNLYQGCTMIARPIYFPHRHGQGEHTITYPWRACDDIVVEMITPHDIENINLNKIDWLKNNETYNVDVSYKCVTGRPFLLKANNFHKTTTDDSFIRGRTIFTVWHELDTFTYEDVINLQNKLKENQ